MTANCILRFPSCAGRRALRIVAAVIALLTLSAIPALHAQILYGSVTGTVSDKTGAVVPNVTVTLTNQGTGEVRSTVANSLGNYDFLDVLPGTYSLSVAAAGNFAGFTQQNVQAEVNRQVRVDITLQPASVSTEITVSEAPPELQTETAEVDSEISQTELAQLPITSSQGRNFESLYTVIPGAADVQEKNSIGGNPARAMSVNVNGNSYNGNTTRIDGAVNYYGWLPYLIAYVPPADSIESVTFTTNDFNAEQGQAGGASIRVTTKSGTRDFHGGAWEYYQDAAFNARGYTATQASLETSLDPTGAVPKNVFQEYGFNIGGPVYIPRILTGKKKLFFFTNFDRITRRQLYAAQFTIPDSNMIGGNFSEAAGTSVIYDPQPTQAWVNSFTPTASCSSLQYVAGYLVPGCRPSFTSEYGETGSSVNTIPAGRIAPAAAIMMQDLAPIAAKIGTPSAGLIASALQNDYNATGTVGYNRNSSDTKITYIPSDSTQIFGKYGMQPYSDVDPQALGAAGGSTLDGGQPGQASGRMQNVGLGMSHVFNPRLVIDADFGYTRQVTGAQSTLDIKDGDYGLDVLHIPGTNGVGPNYVGQPAFYFGSSGNLFSGLGNNQGANPFLFRDNQFTGDVNLSWVKGKHSTKYGLTYYHFDLNHFQPTSGGQPNAPRGGFTFSGGMTCGGASCGVTGYTSLADFLLGLPNNGTGQAIGHPSQVYNPNSLRWTEMGLYAQDQWTVTPKLTLTYGIRYEVYPAPYRDHTGASVLVPGLPQTANVEVGGINGLPRSAGIGAGWGQIVPRFGIAYSVTPKTVVRTGFGLTTDPDSFRYLRDSFPEDLAPSYTGTGNFTIAQDPANNNAAMTLSYGIPASVIPNFSTGFASLPVSGSTNTVPQNFRRGYIESWNFFVQRDLGHQFVANVGYVGTHFVRQQAGVSPYNSAPFPSAATSCMANGQYNPSTGLTGACSFQVNTIFSQTFCNGLSNCYNSGGVTVNAPIFSSSYNAMQSQLSRNAGRNATLGVVYTYSHAIDFEDNGAGSGSQGTVFNYPTMYSLNKGTAGYDEKHNLQIYGIYSLPFGPGQAYVNHGFLGQILGGFQLNGQISHYSGFPFSVSANSNTIGGVAPGFGATYAQLVSPYQQLSGHNRTFGNTAVSGGKAWFNPAAFASPAEPPATTANTSNASPVLPNTSRNEFRGPGNSQVNGEIGRSVHIYRESEIRFTLEAFNLFNHPFLNNPNTTVPTSANVASGNYGSFGLITSFGPGYSQTQGARALQFSGRVNF